ncbi:hypothetical protein T07_6783 [Trichinella nelsoni]|uniref:Uncharacterized protein n=1 Tax=Trichinella nelsoni TaxID=6336 RepID=A0A0V0RTY4_9BILA|nr:hypothetical protein T07_6783 [Trichinella nelsoni]
MAMFNISRYPYLYTIFSDCDFMRTIRKHLPQKEISCSFTVMCAPGLKFSRQFRKAYQKRFAVESTYCAFPFSSGGFIIEFNERRKKYQRLTKVQKSAFISAVGYQVKGLLPIVWTGVAGALTMELFW